MKERFETITQKNTHHFSSEEDSLSEGGDPQGGVSASRETEGDLQTALQAKEEELKGLSDRLLRLQAEFENYKKRTAKERLELIKYANEGLLQEIIPVVDSLDRAIESAREGSRVEGIVEGLELVRRLFSVFLDRSGVKEIRAQGEVFNPELHEAISVVASGEHPEHTVVEEVQRGYALNNRVLRPAIVKVAKALPEGEAGSEGDES